MRFRYENYFVSWDASLRNQWLWFRIMPWPVPKLVEDNDNVNGFIAMVKQCSWFTGNWVLCSCHCSHFLKMKKFKPWFLRERFSHLPCDLFMIWYWNPLSNLVFCSEFRLVSRRVYFCVYKTWIMLCYLIYEIYILYNFM